MRENRTERKDIGRRRKEGEKEKTGGVRGGKGEKAK
jgi:hypothetical protein